MSSLEYQDLCRLCLVKDDVSVPIFEDVGDIHQICNKITTCLPVKVTKEDKLPQKLCNNCVYKVESFYQFWHQTLNVEKQLLQWLENAEKQGYSVGTVFNQSGMKDQSNENRLVGNVMQQVSIHQSNMNMDMDNMGVCMPMMMTGNNQQQITSVPMDTSGSSIQNIQAITGSNTQATHDQITQTQTNTSTQQEEEDESSEDEENSDDECDGDDGLPIKEESEEDPNNSRTIEPTTFVNVSLACEDPGPSGLQQQKMADIQEMAQATDVDPKTGPKNWSVKTHRNVTAADSGETQNVSFFILQHLDNETVLVEKVHAHHCDSCDEDFDTEASLIRHRTEQSILRTRAALRQAEKKRGTCRQVFPRKEQLVDHRPVPCRYTEVKCESRDTVANVIKQEDKLIKQEEKLIKSDETTLAKLDKILVKSDQTFVKPGQAIVMPGQTFVKPGQTFVMPGQTFVMPGQMFVKPGQTFVKSKQTLIKPKQALIKPGQTLAKQDQALIKRDQALIKRDQALIKRDQALIRQDRTMQDNKTTENNNKTAQSIDNNNETEPIKCDKCQKVFKKKRYLKVHQMFHYSPQVCHLCGAKLASEYCLKMHLRRHNKEFTEFCEICNKGFYLKATLRIHMSMHNNDTPCVCDICHKTFGNRTYLRTHMKLHNPETRKKFKCQICSFETFYSYCYKEHMWTHTGESQLACEVCGKLITRQYMKIHMRIHTGDKPEICEFCGKAYSARRYLIKHRRTHTGEKPYKCDICEKRFTQRGTLSRHLRRHESPK